MKKSLEMIANFFAVLIAALIVGMLTYIQFTTIENLVAGHSVDFSKSLYILGLLENAPAVFLLMIPFMLIYKVRHLSNPVATAITYVILCILVWFGLFPLSQIVRNSFLESHQIAVFNISAAESKINDELEIPLSEGYFREVNGKIYYFIQNENLETNSAEVLEIFDSQNSEKFGDKIILNTKETSEFSQAAKPYKDILIKQNMKDTPKQTLKVLDFFYNSVLRSWNNGFISWICFCSLGFFMASAYAFVSVSSWRMINLTYIMIIQFVAIILNTVYYLDSFFNVRLFLNRLFYGRDFSRFQYFQSHLIQLPLVAINVFFGILIIILGIIFNSINRKKHI